MNTITETTEMIELMSEVDVDDYLLDTQAKGICLQCGRDFDWARFKLGYKVCMMCGDKLAKGVRRTIVPMHKSNYVMLTDMDDLKGINNKGGLVK